MGLRPTARFALIRASRTIAPVRDTGQSASQSLASVTGVRRSPATARSACLRRGLSPLWEPATFDCLSLHTRFNRGARVLGGPGARIVGGAPPLLLDDEH